jgi:hypothetical protein
VVSARKICDSRLHTERSRPPPKTIAPPSIGQASSFHVPSPSFAGFVNVAPRSSDVATTMSRDPPSWPRHITKSRPFASNAADGWQQGQMPSGSPKTTRVSLQRPRLSLEELAPQIRGPSFETSIHAQKSSPFGPPASACSPSRAAAATSFTRPS